MPEASAAPVLPDIWPNNLRIPIIGCAGELNSGKTLFGLSIDPPHTKVYDLEKSSESYLGLGFDRVDVGEEMLKRFPNGYTPLEVFDFIVGDIGTIPKGKYNVIMIDPITDMEIGAVEKVQQNPEKFGRTKLQYEKAQGLMWGDLKNYWKAVLLDFTARCQTFFFTAHMRQIWKGNSPTSRREPQGKDTLAKLASLYLLLNRDQDKNGNVPAKPRGRVLKSRLARTSFVNGEPIITPLLPPQLPEATPNAIRAYIVKPPNYEKLSSKEKIPDKKLTEDQQLELKADTANAELETEELKAGRFEQMEAAADLINQRKKERNQARTVDEQSEAKPTDGILEAVRAQDAPPSGLASPEKEESLTPEEMAAVEGLTVEEQGEQDQSSTLDRLVPPAATEDGSLHPEMLQMVTDQTIQLGMSKQEIERACKKRDCEKLEDLSPEQAQDIFEKMRNLLKQIKMEKNVGK